MVESVDKLFGPVVVDLIFTTVVSVDGLVILLSRLVALLDTVTAGEAEVVG